MSTENCPHCGKSLEPPTEYDPSDPNYDPSDPIQKRGFDDQVWNEKHVEENKRTEQRGGFRKNEYAPGSPEFYRWNRGARAKMDTP